VSAEIWSALGLGLVLGVRHALDVDHVVAVTTIVSRHRTVRRAAWIGAWWGIGHSAILLAVGTTVVAFKLAISQRLALSFELIVGLMLVFLGGRVLWQVARERWHWHVHDHSGGIRHAHVHVHGTSGHDKARAEHSHGPDEHGDSPTHRHGGSATHEHTPHDHAHVWKLGVRPFVVGMVHGLAGSAGLTLLVGTALPSVSFAILYFALFGAGSVIGMSVLTLAMSVPFAVAAERMGPAYRALVFVAGLGSLIVGVYVIHEVGWVEGLFV
jgi:high-affinity nickel-transport protein